MWVGQYLKPFDADVHARTITKIIASIATIFCLENEFLAGKISFTQYSYVKCEENERVTRSLLARPWVIFLFCLTRKIDFSVGLD